MALWPTVTPVPRVNGYPRSVCITLPSCTSLFSPMWINSLSPRRTAPNQTLAPASSLILPTSVALGATQLCGCASTRDSPRRYFTTHLFLSVVLRPTELPLDPATVQLRARAARHER